VPYRGGCPTASRNGICGGGWESGRSPQMIFQRRVGSRGAFTDKCTAKIQTMFVTTVHIYIFIFYTKQKIYHCKYVVKLNIHIHTHVQKLDLGLTIANHHYSAPFAHPSSSYSRCRNDHGVHPWHKGYYSCTDRRHI